MYRPSRGDYFYLSDDSYSSPVGRGFKKAELLNDLRRGVMRLPEDAYTDDYGHTMASLQFLRLMSDVIDIRGVEAELRYSPTKHYRLFVKTVNGFTMVFYGVSGGYYGEGSRGCYDILKACGFSEKQCQRVWERDNFRIVKRK